MIKNFINLVFLTSIMLAKLNCSSFAMQELIRDEINIGQKLRKFKTCKRTEGGKTEWLYLKKGEWAWSHLARSFTIEDCPFKEFCDFHNSEIKSDLTFLLEEIRRNLEPYRENQQKKKELLDLKIQIKKKELDNINKKPFFII